MGNEKKPLVLGATTTAALDWHGKKRKCSLRPLFPIMTHQRENACVRFRRLYYSRSNRSKNRSDIYTIII